MYGLALDLTQQNGFWNMSIEVTHHLPLIDIWSHYSPSIEKFEVLSNSSLVIGVASKGLDGISNQDCPKEG